MSQIIHGWLVNRSEWHSDLRELDDLLPFDISSVINQRTILGGDTILHFVLKNEKCSSSIVRLLLACGASVFVKDRLYDMTPLEIALRFRRDEKTLMFLLEKGALESRYDPHPPYFCLAVVHQAPMSVIDTIIRSRRGLDQCEFTNHPSMFHCALSSPHPTRTLLILRRLLEFGFSLSIEPELLCAALRCVNNLDALHFLIENDIGFEAIQMMLHSVTDVDLNSFSDVFGNSLLHTAVQNKNCSPSLVELLIKKGVDVNHVNKLGDTALDEAVLNKDCPESVLVILLENSSKLNPRTISLSRSNTKLVKLLLATGVSLDEKRYLRELQNCADSICFISRHIIYFQYLLRYYLLEYSDSNLPFLKNVHTHYNNIMGYRDRCFGELTRLKSLKAGLNRTAIDLLGRNSSLRGAATSMEDKISDFNCLLKAISGHSFPLYRYIIVDKVTRPVLENEIYQTKIYVFKFVDRKRIDIVLNSDCLKFIVQHLTDVDLLDLILAYFKWDHSTSCTTESSYQNGTAESAKASLLKRLKLDE